MLGEYKIAKQINGVGFYCHVRVNVTQNKDAAYDLKIILEDEIEKYNSKYINLIKAGIEYFEGTFPIERKGTLNVTVTFFSAMPVDTKPMAVIFCVAKALTDAFKLEAPNLFFNEENMSFSFPGFVKKGN